LRDVFRVFGRRGTFIDSTVLNDCDVVERDAIQQEDWKSAA
jgi:hypothetical protein